MKKIISYLFVLLFVPGMVSAQCNVCYGHKKVTRTENCSYCQGVGSFSEKVTKTCTNCGGKGYTTNSCSSCNGRGTVTTTKRCSACNGAGGHWKPKTCWSCQGSGKEYYTDYYFNERRSKACSKCGGDGSINELVKCTTCGGNKNSVKLNHKVITRRQTYVRIAGSKVRNQEKKSLFARCSGAFRHK